MKSNSVRITAGTINNNTATADMDMRNFVTYGIQATFTGAAVAVTAKLQESNDGTNWKDISGSSVSVVAAGSHVWKGTGFGMSWIRLSMQETGAANVGYSGMMIAKEH